MTYTYAWRVDGSIVGSGAALPGTAFSKGESVTLSVTPNDGELDGSTALSSAVTVMNTAPAGASATISPADPAEGVDDLVCEVSASDADGDTLTNIQEFGFGTDPTSSSTGVIQWSGASVTNHGTPVIIEESGNYYAVYGRRVNYVTAGLTYTQQFSADLTSTWYTDTTTPTVIATDGVIDAVKIALPGLIPTDSGPQKARFFQCGVSQ